MVRNVEYHADLGLSDHGIITCNLQKLAATLKGNPKDVWRYCKSKLKNKTGLGDIQREVGSLTSDDHEKAEILNKYFRDVIITPDLVEKKLNKLNVSQSAASDGFHSQVLKELSSAIKTPLEIIFSLSAAKLLVEGYDLKVVVLEARDRVGGRTWTVEDPDYGYTDIGGAYVGPTQRRVFRLAKELGVETYYVNQKEKTILNIKGTFMKYHGTIPPVLNPIKAMDLNNVQHVLNKLASQERKFIGGAMQLSTKMAVRLGDRVKLGHRVVSVEQTNSGVLVTCANGQKFKSHYVISGMPQVLLNQVTFDPPLSPMMLQMIQRMPMGSIIKTMMFYKTAFWKEKGVCGEMVTDRGPVLYCVDDTKPDGSHPCIMGFILANHARELANMTPEQRKDAIIHHYAKMFNDKRFLQPLNYVEKNWAEEEYSGGCYVSVMPPGVLTSFGHIIRDPHGRVHFAGTECATYWAGYMEGAIQSGERAAREVLCLLNKINESDIDQEEPLLAEFPEHPVNVTIIEHMLPSVSSFLWCTGAVLTCLVAWYIPKYILK
ncbi:hypothetical protein LSH36_271g07045 [Paralvinella palmiformis]|uniref:monoamine oxidase n=1 Tax=Paralvinella palmiformis TaxID=53620 RepID=A0AAD9JKV2_9ANNE|nr:hypothetical protein LSH36_271g07045 [Paralvinella palmiformis]